MLPDNDISLLATAFGLSTPDAEQMVTQLGGLAGLRDTDAAALMAAGLDAAQAEQVLALLELARRLNALPSPNRALVRAADDAAALLSDMATLAQEQVRVMLLDANRRCVAVETVYIGTVHGTLLRVAEVFRPALARNFPSFILAHNHPSGDPAPSPEDIELTRTLVAAGRILDIALVDHLIIGSDGWVSLKEMRLGFD
jgi:DNA repair protein RadC